MIAVTLGAISLAGCAGLYACPPRPAQQETWAIVAITPIMLLLFWLLGMAATS